MSDIELVKPKRWEGKPFKFRIKYLIANYPEFALAGATFGFIAPLIIFYRYYFNKDSRDEALKKYKTGYIVVRDDDPQVEKIKAEKEYGRHLFPKF